MIRLLAAHSQVVSPVVSGCAFDFGCCPAESATWRRRNGGVVRTRRGVSRSKRPRRCEPVRCRHA